MPLVTVIFVINSLLTVRSIRARLLEYEFGRIIFVPQSPPFSDYQVIPNPIFKTLTGKK